ncbi:MAG: Bax inhibitor-1 family protein [Planctomycetota bacterium]
MNNNPYASSHVGYADVAANSTVDARSTFLRKTYLHLLGAILAFVAMEAIILNVFHAQLEPLIGSMVGGYSWLIVLGAFMVVSYIADSWAHSRTSRSMQYLGLALYVVAETIIFVPLLYFAEKVGPDTIPTAGVITGIVFGGLSIVVLFTKADFSFLKWGLIALSFIALGLIVASIAIGFSLGLWFSVAMVALACGIILYNTSRALHHYDTEQYVAASLALFASIALLFWYVIQLVMAFSSD